MPTDRTCVPALALLLAATGCQPSAVPAPNAPLPQGVVLISIDTLRADRLGIYGAAADASPNLDALAQESVVFEQAYAAAPSTLPSHASLFTGQTPNRHGAFFARRSALPESATTLAESFLAAGWRTGAFHNGAQMAPIWGLWQGFESYERVRRNRTEALAGQGLEWLDQGPEEPFFLFLHTYHVHAPYEPEPNDLAPLADPAYDGRIGDSISIRALEAHNEAQDLRPEDVRHIDALYRAGIRAMDRQLGELVETLRHDGRLDQMLLIVLADHGEELGDRTHTGWHAHTLYEELLRVPLIIRFPGAWRGGTRIPAPVSLIDIAPTLQDLMGFTRPASVDGQSLLPLILDPSASPSRAHVVAVRDEEGPEPLTAVRRGRFKLIGTALYDLEADPGETTDVAAAHPEIVAELRTLLTAPASRADGTAVEVDPETAAELDALGYL